MYPQLTLLIHSLNHSINPPSQPTSTPSPPPTPSPTFSPHPPSHPLILPPSPPGFRHNESSVQSLASSSANLLGGTSASATGLGGPLSTHPNILTPGHTLIYANYQHILLLPSHPTLNPSFIHILSHPHSTPTQPPLNSPSPTLTHPQPPLSQPPLNPPSPTLTPLPPHHQATVHGGQG